MFDRILGSRFAAPTLAAIGFVLIAGFLGVRTWLYQSFNIPSEAMEPGLEVGDYILVSKSAYGSASPQRGDMIVFHPHAQRLYFVKRVAGLPGDRVYMRNGRLVINDAMVPQRRIADRLEACETSSPCHVAQYEETLPGGRVVRVLDRMQDGMLDNTPVFAVPADSYFVLGDNRDNSDDSRADIGFVSRSEIVGRVVRRFISGGELVWQDVN